MIGTAADILTLEGNLAKLGVTLTAVVDPTVETPGPTSGGENQAEDYLRGWIRQHPSGTGAIMVKILCRKAPQSGLIDPVDVRGTGLLGYIEDHS